MSFAMFAPVIAGGALGVAALAYTKVSAAYLRRRFADSQEKQAQPQVRTRNFRLMKLSR